jgi:hypothetical protein
MRPLGASGAAIHLQIAVTEPQQTSAPTPLPIDARNIAAADSGRHATAPHRSDGQ